MAYETYEQFAISKEVKQAIFCALVVLATSQTDLVRTPLHGAATGNFQFFDMLDPVTDYKANDFFSQYGSHILFLKFFSTCDHTTSKRDFPLEDQHTWCAHVCYSQHRCEHH
jgi:hypothetical protein